MVVIRGNLLKCIVILRDDGKRACSLRKIALQKSNTYITFFDSDGISRKGLYLARESEKHKKEKKARKKGLLREYLEAAAIAILLALFIRAFVVQAFKIPSGSMEPTLLIGDHILVNKFIYGIKVPFVNKTIIPISEPKRGDIIVFIYPLDRKKDFIKRAIGLPGDEIRIVNNRIYINGKPYDDPHGVYEANENGNRNLGPIIVPDDSLFVMGDNRDHSYDSRYWGFVPMESVKGKAMIIYWSWPHWKRFAHIIK
ncbi:MAG: signal peptidase I [Deltaproteobacteria bacterium]|nr:signal peptidase I [Deltaproteobacteria bacterium]MBW2077604.1 signal peptidase I [Deltaproteobacteria bacterium]MBW2310545.1 signal peptidase I [Deltaproteobacteria bacterium]RLB30860.1 MAG: signal peptidase I [Deltaproteobacteria bacterium]